MVYQSGPINIESGNSAKFTVEFLTPSGNLTIPSSGNFTVTYTNTSNVTVTDNVALTQSNSFFTGTWSSTSASLGLAGWQVTAAGSTLVQASGQIRIIQRQSTI